MPEQTDENSGSYFKKLTDALKDAFKDITKGTQELMQSLDTTASSVVGKMGQSRNFAAGLQSSLSLAVPELQQISASGDNFADALKRAADAQLNILEATNTNLLLTTKQMVAIAEVTAAYGLQSQSVQRIAEGFLDAGESINNFPTALEKSVNYARGMGVNVGAVMSLIETNIKEVNKYGFRDGVEGLGRMAAHAAGMRISLTSVFNLAEDIFNPEKAIELVATFQRLGVATGELADPFRLMYLAREDTEEFGKQITKLTQNFSFFDEKTKTFKLFPNAKADLRDLQAATRIPYEDLVKMSQSAERLKVIGKEIKLGAVSEEQKQLISNLAQFDKNKGGFVIKFATGDEKLVSQINSEDLKKLEEANRELSPKEIARAQMDTNKLIQADVAAIKATIVAPTAGARIVSSTEEVLRGTSKAIRSGFQAALPSDQYQQSLNKSIESGLLSINDLISGKKGLGDILNQMSQFGGNFVEGIKNFTSQMVNFTYGKEFKSEIMSDNQLKILGDGIYNGLKEGISGIASAVGIDSKGFEITQTINQNQNVKVEDIKVNVSGDVKVIGQDGKPITVSPEIQSLIKSQIQQELDNRSKDKGTMSLKPSEARVS